MHNLCSFIQLDIFPSIRKNSTFRSEERLLYTQKWITEEKSRIQIQNFPCRPTTQNFICTSLIFWFQKHELTPWCKVLEKIIVAETVNTFPAFCRTRIFCTHTFNYERKELQGSQQRDSLATGTNNGNKENCQNEHLATKYYHCWTTEIHGISYILYSTFNWHLSDHISHGRIVMRTVFRNPSVFTVLL